MHIAPMIVALLFSAGVWLLLSRDWLKTIIGLSLMSHAVNLIILKSGENGFLDPLPQALVLTAIVIGFGFQSFLLVLACLTYRKEKNLDVDQMSEGVE